MKTNLILKISFLTILGLLSLGNSSSASGESPLIMTVQSTCGLTIFHLQVITKDENNPTANIREDQKVALNVSPGTPVYVAIKDGFQPPVSLYSPAVPAVHGSTIPVICKYDSGHIFSLH